MACTETFSTLVIVSSGIDPEEIESLVGIQGTTKRAKESDSKYRHRRENGVWKWCTEQFIDSVDNNAHIAKVIEVFRSKSDDLERLRKLGCKTELWNYWDSTGQGGPSLKVNTMQELVDLGLDIVWDIYFDEQSE